MSAQAQRMRGLSSDREIDPNDIHRDVRTPGQKIHAFFSDSPTPALALSAMLLPTAFISTTFFCLVALPLIYWMTGIAFNREQVLPLLLPREAGIEDRSDPKPSRRGNFKSRGEFLVGNQRFGKRPYELYLAFAHLLQHEMLLGGSGSGKTETLVSKVANYLSVGSGVMYSDAKAAPKLGWQLYSLCRFFGREDDFRSLNYIKGNISTKPDPAIKRSNNVNLFTYGSAESITQIIVSLMPPGGGENKLFSERAIGLISAVMPGLIDLRDKAGLKINPGVIRKALEFEEVQKLKRAKLLSPESREALRAYLSSLPGYTENPVDKNGKPTDQQPSEVTRQFGFAQAYFTRALASLSDTYGDLYMVGRGELNVLDIILRRRVCVVLIPALEKAPDEMKNLSKVVLAAQKNAISTGIPPDIEGRKEDVLDSLPITASVPYGIINDEFAFMMTPGYGAVLAQARGLFTAVTIAGQDYAGMKREDADEAEQIAENTKIKIVMGSEGLGATRELIQEIAGEGMVATASSFAMDENSLSMDYRDSKSAGFEKRARVDVRDTRAAVEGEGIIFWRDRIVPVNMFYHGMDEKEIISDYPITRLLDVDLPQRGYGKSVLEPDNPITASLKKAVQDGSVVNVDHRQIPEGVFGLPMEKALPRFRQWVKANPGSSTMDRDGVLAHLLFKHEDEERTRALTEEDDGRHMQAQSPLPQGDDDRIRRKAQAGAQTTRTLAPPETRNDEPIFSVDKDEAHQVRKTMIDIEDEQAAISALEEEIPESSGEPDVPGDADSSRLPNNRVTASAEKMRESSLVSHAPWVIDTRQLADRAGRPVYPSEARVAAACGEGAAKLEEALGQSAEIARQVGQETAHAVIRGFEYPSHDTPTPAAPRTPDEENLVIKDQARTVNRMKAWVESNN